MSLLVVTAKQMKILEPHMASLLEEKGINLRVISPVGQGFSSDEMIQHAEGATVLIAGDDQLDSRFFASAPGLKAVIRWGVGLDSVDISAATECGVSILNTPGLLGQAVAEYALGLMLSLARSLHDVHSGVRRGEWMKPRGINLIGKTVGVVGLGDVGKSILEICGSIGMNCRYFDPYAEVSIEGWGSEASIHSLARGSDFLVCACPLTSETRNLVDSSVLDELGSRSYLINVSRGGVVDEVALLGALRSRLIGGAAIDVFQIEPPASTNPFLRAPNVLFGTHNASNTLEAVDAVNRQAFKLAINYL